MSTLASSCQSVLSTEAMLTVLVDSSAHTWNYVGRDVLGQLGGLMVMAGMTKNTDKNPVKSLWVSHGLQQASMALILCTPSLPADLFLPVAAAANMCANVAFINYGSLNAKCIQKLSADKNNVGELYSKLTLQQTLASTIGLSVGMVLNECCTSAAIVPLDARLLFLVLGCIRVHCCNRAVRSVL